MSLGTGTRIGSSKIVAPLGAGGVGEVDRACGVRLARRQAQGSDVWAAA